MHVAKWERESEERENKWKMRAKEKWNNAIVYDSIVYDTIVYEIDTNTCPIVHMYVNMCV